MSESHSKMARLPVRVHSSGWKITIWGFRIKRGWQNQSQPLPIPKMTCVTWVLEGSLFWLDKGTWWGTLALSSIGFHSQFHACLTCSRANDNSLSIMFSILDLELRKQYHQKLWGGNHNNWSSWSCSGHHGSAQSCSSMSNWTQAVKAANVLQIPQPTAGHRQPADGTCQFGPQPMSGGWRSRMKQNSQVNDVENAEKWKSPSPDALQRVGDGVPDISQCPGCLGRSHAQTPIRRSNVGVGRIQLRPLSNPGNRADSTMGATKMPSAFRVFECRIIAMFFAPNVFECFFGNFWCCFWHFCRVFGHGSASGPPDHCNGPARVVEAIDRGSQKNRKAKSQSAEPMGTERSKQQAVASISWLKLRQWDSENLLERRTLLEAAPAFNSSNGHKTH